MPTKAKPAKSTQASAKKPAGGKAKDARWIDIHEDDLDEAQMAKWVKQAAANPGWGKS